MTTCPDCNGIGHHVTEGCEIRCFLCDGDGTVYIRCKACDGVGFVRPATAGVWPVCTACEGKGELPCKPQ